MELIDKNSLVGQDGLFSKRGCPGNCQHCGLWSNKGCRVILEAPTVDTVPVDEIKFHHILIDKDGIPEVKLQFGERVLILRRVDDPLDVVEVVRCKDCEHSRKWGNNGTLLCYRDETTIHIVKPDAYCDGSQRRYAADDPEILKFEPVVHGRWIEDYVYAADPHDRLRYKCSVCGRTEEDKEPYCNCGAKMEVGW